MDSQPEDFRRAEKKISKENRAQSRHFKLTHFTGDNLNCLEEKNPTSFWAAMSF